MKCIAETICAMLKNKPSFKIRFCKKYDINISNALLIANVFISDCRMKRKSVASKINKALDENESLLSKICEKAASIK